MSSEAPQVRKGTIEKRHNFKLASDQKRKPIKYLKHVFCKPLPPTATHPCTESSMPTNKIFLKIVNSKAIKGYNNKEHVYCKSFPPTVVYSCTGICLNDILTPFGC